MNMKNIIAGLEIYNRFANLQTTISKNASLETEYFPIDKSLFTQLLENGKLVIDTDKNYSNLDGSKFWMQVVKPNLQCFNEASYESDQKLYTNELRSLEEILDSYSRLETIFIHKKDNLLYKWLEVFGLRYKKEQINYLLKEGFLNTLTIKGSDYFTIDAIYLLDLIRDIQERSLIENISWQEYLNDVVDKKYVSLYNQFDYLKSKSLITLLNARSIALEIDIIARRIAKKHKINNSAVHKAQIKQNKDVKNLVSEFYENYIATNFEGDLISNTVYNYAEEICIKNPYLFESSKQMGFAEMIMSSSNDYLERDLSNSLTLTRNSHQTILMFYYPSYIQLKDLLEVHYELSYPEPWLINAWRSNSTKQCTVCKATFVPRKSGGKEQILCSKKDCRKEYKRRNSKKNYLKNKK